jgi:hypothetical protein
MKYECQIVKCREWVSFSGRKRGSSRVHPRCCELLAEFLAVVVAFFGYFGFEKTAETAGFGYDSAIILRL